MGDPTSAANDPIFYLQHAFIDMVIFIILLMLNAPMY